MSDSRRPESVLKLDTFQDTCCGVCAHVMRGVASVRDALKEAVGMEPRLHLSETCNERIIFQVP